jgi:hypothetical protein
MGTADVRIDTRLNKAIWAQGVRGTPFRSCFTFFPHVNFFSQLYPKFQKRSSNYVGYVKKRL